MDGVVVRVRPFLARSAGPLEPNRDRLECAAAHYEPLQWRRPPLLLDRASPSRSAHCRTLRGCNATWRLRTWVSRCLFWAKSGRGACLAVCTAPLLSVPGKSGRGEAEEAVRPVRVRGQGRGTVGLGHAAWHKLKAELQKAGETHACTARLESRGRRNPRRPKGRKEGPERARPRKRMRGSAATQS